MKLFRYLFMTIMAVVFTMPLYNKAEAATIALLPMINNVAERDDLSSIYFDRAVNALKLANDWEISESDKLDKAIAENTKQGVLPDQNACENIARDGSVDAVFVMKLDMLDVDENAFSAADENYALIKIKGNCVSYNALTGKFQKRNVIDDKRVAVHIMARYDIPGDFFADAVTREVKKFLEIKKFTVEKPKISKAGFKGDRR